MAKKTYEMDMCNGPLLGKIILFYIPLMLSSVLQLLFNAADVVVVGRFAGNEALAAVGSTGSLINLLTNVFIGLSVGANVLIARFYGARQDSEVSDTIHTSILLSLISGVLLAILGFFLARPLLEWMGTPDDVIGLAIVYVRIYFLGMPAMLLYNFGSAILRAVGDTRRPLYFLTFAGIINVLLNLLFVTSFHMSVAGVALATVISQAVSAFLIIRCLCLTSGSFHLDLGKLRLHKDKVLKILRIGLPAGMQGAIFSISNVLIQSSVNSFGSVAMAGNTAGANLEGFVYVAMNSLYQTSLSFTSQNFGAGNYKRIHKVLLTCLGLVTVIGMVFGNTIYLFGKQLLGLYSSDASVIQYGLQRMSIICVFYFICGIMDVLVGCIRGLGYSIMPTFVSLLGACVFRIVWIFTIFQYSRTLFTLYISYPISWLLTGSIHLLCYFLVTRKFAKLSRSQ